MYTRLLEHVEPLADDPLIMQKLRFSQKGDGPEGGAYPMGIRNAQGDIYRLIQARGVGETMRVVRIMQMLGFTEEDHESPAEGCNSTFRLRHPVLH